MRIRSKMSRFVPLLFVAAVASAAPTVTFEKDLQPFLDSHCVRCHGEKKQQGDFRLDELSREIGFKDTPLWAEVMERISSGEMPPEDVKNRPSADQSATIVEWLAARIEEGESARMARRDRVSYNRLTREEYVNTMRDLIGVHYDATDPGGLLEDPEWNGFERLGSVLTLSATHVEKYITAAETVLSEAYPETKPDYVEVSKPAIQPHQIRDHHRERLAAKGMLGKVRFEMWPGDIFRYSNAFNQRDRRVEWPGPGIYEITYQLSGLKPADGRAPRLHVYEKNLDRVLFEQDIIAPEERPTTVTFRAHFPSTRTPTIHVFNKVPGPSNSPRSGRHGNRPFVSTKEGRLPWQMKLTDEQGLPRYPFLIVDSVTIKGPIVTAEEQRRRDEYMPTETGKMEQVRTGFRALAKRAFRRPLIDGELDSYVRIVEGELAAGEGFYEAVKSGMTAILCSKSFLFIAEGDEDLDRHMLNDWEIASRLSYLFWSTMPDDELFAAAERGILRNKGELRRQVSRMLADPRAERFTKSFPAQWLHLRKVGMFPPDKKIYPEYDEHLEQSMVGETQAFFGEVLQRGLTLRAFLDSDWTMVNPRLARFYGIPDVTKDVFQRVSLKPEHHRGGLLTHASILSLTSDGTRHRPVHRGAWLSEAIFGKAPPSPPANVDPIEPNPVTAPKATLRMKLEAHKHDPSCASCHRKIDPLGLAFDNYDAIGAWRMHETVVGTGTDPLVDASGELPDGRSFQDADEFKKLLLGDLDAFNAAFIEKLAIYGMRRTLTFEDREELEAIAKAGRANNYRVRDIVAAFVQSDLFQKR
ncbi:MAG: hypothetical protein ACI91J_000445 [Yoonia sp.]|jgi:hypothetical protein